MKSFMLYSRDLDVDPYPGYKLLRDSHPCYKFPDADVWILTRYDDVAQAAADWHTFSSLGGNLIDEIPGRPGGSLGTTDPPRHDRLRALVQKAFSRNSVETLEPIVAEIVRDVIDKIPARESFDFSAQVSAQVSVRMILSLLGFPERDALPLRDDVVLAISTDKSIRGRNASLDAAFERVKAFVAQEVDLRRQNPSDDLVTRLTEAEIDGDKLSDREILLTVTMFVIAGIESMSGLLSMMAINFATLPEMRKRVACDQGLLPKVIEETLRFNTPAQRFKRVLTKDVGLHGQEMKTGDIVALAYGAANRDERKFPNPDVFDLDRNTSGHLGFGAGKHFCVGSLLARMVARVTFAEFLKRFPMIELEERGVIWNSSSNFRAPNQLYLKYIST